MIGGGVLAALALAISACAPAIRAQSAPAPEPDESPVFEREIEPANPPEGEPAAPTQTQELAAATSPAAPAPESTAPTSAAPASTPPASTPQVDAKSATEPKAPAAATQSPAQAPAVVAAAAKPSAATEMLVIGRGDGNLALMIPRNETLVYEVHLNLGWLGSPTVGKVTLTSNTLPFYPDQPNQPVGEQVLLSGRAEGSYRVYTLDNTISSTLLPQAWPRTVHRNVQTGSESRSRETLLGTMDGKPVSRYRGDGHCKGCKNTAHYVSGTWPWSDDEHCKKCKRPDHRVWKEPKVREVPEGTFDMLTAVYLARSLVVDGRPRVEFPLIDRNDLWQVQLTHGRTKRIETNAGKYNCVEVELRTGPPEGSAPGETTKFEGLFGIHGTISIWMEAASGVPVRIEGAVPAGPVDLDVTIDLHSARGAPRGFDSQRQ